MLLPKHMSHEMTRKQDFVRVGSGSSPAMGFRISTTKITRKLYSARVSSWFEFLSTLVARK